MHRENEDFIRRVRLQQNDWERRHGRKLSYQPIEVSSKEIAPRTPEHCFICDFHLNVQGYCPACSSYRASRGQIERLVERGSMTVGQVRVARSKLLNPQAPRWALLEKGDDTTDQ